MLSCVVMLLQVMGLEVEVVRVSRDTTESDLKQRREISGGTAAWTDQAPVRAALEGRVLILDGIEKEPPYTHSTPAPEPSLSPLETRSKATLGGGVVDAAK
jgi:hypothetical protein